MIEQMTPPSLGALLKQEVNIDKYILFRDNELPLAGVSANKQKQTEFFVYGREYTKVTQIFIVISNLKNLVTVLLELWSNPL